MENNIITPFYRKLFGMKEGLPIMEEKKNKVNYGEFALIKNLASLNRYEIVATQPIEKTQHHCHTTTKIIDHKPNY